MTRRYIKAIIPNLGLTFEVFTWLLVAAIRPFTKQTYFKLGIARQSIVYVRGLIVSTNPSNLGMGLIYFIYFHLRASFGGCFSIFCGCVLLAWTHAIPARCTNAYELHMSPTIFACPCTVSTWMYAHAYMPIVTPNIANEVLLSKVKTPMSLFSS